MNTRPILKTHLDAVLYFMKKMDADMVSTLLDDGNTYQSLNKHLFIRKLEDLFWEFAQLGDFYLLTEGGVRYDDEFSQAFSFIGNKSKAFIDIVILTDKDKRVVDMYEICDFREHKTSRRKAYRLVLDKYMIFDQEEDEDQYDGRDEGLYGDDELPF